jgi:hypothetical protein
MGAICGKCIAFYSSPFDLDIPMNRHNIAAGIGTLQWTYMYPENAFDVPPM